MQIKWKSPNVVDTQNSVGGSGCTVQNKRLHAGYYKRKKQNALPSRGSGCYKPIQLSMSGWRIDKLRPKRNVTLGRRLRTDLRASLQHPLVAHLSLFLMIVVPSLQWRTDRACEKTSSIHSTLRCVSFNPTGTNPSSTMLPVSILFDHSFSLSRIPLTSTFPHSIFSLFASFTFHSLFSFLSSFSLFLCF